MLRNNRIVSIVIVVAFVALALFMLFGDDMEQIPDTNGAEDFSLATITEDMIVNQSIGCIGPLNFFDGILSDTVEVSASCFSGVYELLYDNFILPSDFTLTLTGYERVSGNFQIVVVYNDEIVAQLEPGNIVEYRLENVTGYVSVRLVGESANFHFTIGQMEYDNHAHN